MEPIRVMIVDDHAVVRSGLAAFLLAYSDLELVAEADSGHTALALCEEQMPDVILMDLVMPEMDGAATTRAIKARYPQIQVVALTSFREDELVQGALQAGAIGYLLKNISANQLADAIRAAHAGRPTLDPEATRVLMEAARKPAEIHFDLTPREQEVLALVTHGANNGEIAAKLRISQSTVKYHVSSILAKLGASSRTEAAMLAVQHRLVP
ncbi:response regulator [Candidatus Chloroploca asiatica]|uniref:DNA-binding response regulator n=1 Tax=Candidatus Chloroploca asiatica TaxID=1506545 RepID=A0A2H3KN99_9CHLR|nr:response regulator transcription factor [Candidatus Chloroploca asiatica]PDV99678.1 DNA-binding response regulator [Candidatus Chloroploca asiatica]